VRPSELAARTLVVGDPGRAEQAAAFLADASQVAANREYVTYTGRLGESALSICSHGVGSAGAGICFEELARGGVKAIVRAGTCGSLRDDIGDGDLVVATGAVRNDGLSMQLAPPGYPAVPDLGLTERLLAAGSAAERATHAGLVLTTDLFYPPAVFGQDWEVWQKSRVIAVEMELAALFVIATLHDMAAAGVLTVDGNPAQGAPDMSDYDPYRKVVKQGTAEMLRLALEALAGYNVEAG
jgi:uridine phosphorylase